jgi:hypothetical protein
MMTGNGKLKETGENPAPLRIKKTINDYHFVVVGPREIYHVFKWKFLHEHTFFASLTKMLPSSTFLFVF